MEGPLLLLALVLLAVAPSPSLALAVDDVACEGRMGKVVGRGPWKVTFGDCEFTGNTDGAPLVRTGSCPDAEGSLDLEYRNITVVPATAFQGMGKMTKLYLDVNLLSALSEGIFAGLASLNELHLKCNQLTTLKAGVFDGLSSLQVLKLATNQLKLLPSGVFAGLSSLTDLDLGVNPLFPLPGDTFAGLASLRILRVYSYHLRCVPLTSEARAALWPGQYNGPIICNNLPVVAVCGGVVGLMALSVSVSYYFKIRGRVTEKTMIMNAGVCSAVAQIAAVIVVVRGAQSSEVDLWSFGIVVLVLLVPFDIWSLWSYLKKNKQRREYLALFETKCKDRDGHISQTDWESSKENFAGVSTTGQNTRNTRVMPSPGEEHKKIVWKDKKWVDDETGNPSSLTGKSSNHPKKTFRNKNSQDSLKNFPFKWLDKGNKGKISRKEYEEGFELFEAFLQFEAGICGPLCLLLRAKCLDEKERQKTKTEIVRDVTGELASVVPHPSPVPGTPSPAEIPYDGHSVCGGRCKQPSEAPKCDIKTLNMGCSAVAAQGLRSAVGLDDDEVFANMMKEPELAIECEILVAGLGGHADGCIDDIDNYYSVKLGKSWSREEEWKDEENEIVIHNEYGKAIKAPIPQHVKNSAKVGKYHGGDFEKKDYDKGNQGKKLKDFHDDPASVLAGLFIYEVLILRLYTSTTYRLFNGPMRSLLDGQKLQHPLRFTIYALTEGVKKLRAVEAKSDEEGFTSTKELWRGMKNMVLDKSFQSKGGTEMAVMSTTSDKEVALSYASSDCPLVFKYTTVGLTRGVKIQFLSLYPKEVEYVYPPLTFLTSIGHSYKEGNVTIVEVSPQMS